MKIVNLTKKHCKACEGYEKPMNSQEAEKYLEKVLWLEISGDGKSITKEFKFNNVEKSQTTPFKAWTFRAQENCRKKEQFSVQKISELNRNFHASKPEKTFQVFLAKKILIRGFSLETKQTSAFKPRL